MLPLGFASGLLHQETIIQSAVFPITADDQFQELFEFLVLKLPGPLFQFLRTHGVGVGQDPAQQPFLLVDEDAPGRVQPGGRDGGQGGEAFTQHRFVHPQPLAGGFEPQVPLHRVLDGLKVRPQFFQNTHPALDIQAVGGDEVFQQVAEPGLGRLPGRAEQFHPVGLGVTVRVQPRRQGQGPHRQILLGEQRQGPLHGPGPGGVAVIDQHHLANQPFQQPHLLPGQGGAQGGQDIADTLHLEGNEVQIALHHQGHPGLA